MPSNTIRELPKTHNHSKHIARSYVKSHDPTLPMTTNSKKVQSSPYLLMQLLEIPTPALRGAGARLLQRVYPHPD